MDEEAERSTDDLATLIREGRGWLTARIMARAQEYGFDRQGPRLEAAWELSVRSFDEPVELALARPDLSTRLDATVDFVHHPLTAFGIAAARRHREQGVALSRFIALFKHYRRAHADLVAAADLPPERRRQCAEFLDNVFDFVEIGIVGEWTGCDHATRLDELEAANRRAIAERLKYVTIFDSLAGPAIVLDAAERIENANLAALRTFGDEAVPGAGYYTRRAPPLLASQLPAVLAAALDDGSVALETARGARHFRVTMHRLLDATEPAAGRVIQLADVSDYVDELAASALADRAKTAFLATMSHELRTPLNGIMGALALLEAENPGLVPDPVVHAIRGSAELLLALVDDVLDYSRLETAAPRLRPQPVAIMEALEGAVASIAPRARAKGLTLETALLVPPDLVVELDRSKLQRIVMNLLDNALKFTDVGRIRCEARWQAGLEVEADRLEVVVSDTGRGFPADQTEQMFAPFTRYDDGVSPLREGSGLGLAICRRLAAALGGTIEATSASGVGSTFRLAVAAPRARVAAAPERSSGHVLVVEDHAVSSMLTERLLTHAGYRVRATGTAAAAWRALIDDGPFDAVVMDVRLPNVDGIALASQIARYSPGLPMITLTADVSPETEAAARAAGAAVVLHKPDGLHRLHGVLAGLLGGTPAAPLPRAARLDRTRLAGHLRVLGIGTVRVILQAFERSGDATVAALLAVGDAADPALELEAIVERLHGLRGAAAQLGLDGLAEACAGLQIVAQAGDLEGVLAERDAFGADILDARRALEGCIDELLADTGSHAQPRLNPGAST